MASGTTGPFTQREWSVEEWTNQPWWPIAQYSEYCMMGPMAAREFVAQRLLTIPEGARIPTTGALAEAAGVGVGTVHQALTALREMGAVELTARGHLGTTLVSRDLPGLWAASGIGAVVGALPLPQSLEFEGLATALTEEFENAGIPLQLVFRQGGTRRVALLDAARADFIALSTVAAARLDRTRVEVMSLPKYTFYGEGSLVVIERAARHRKRPRRVAIDSSSYDHTMLTKAEFPHAQYVDVHYIRIPQVVAQGEVDAAVWHTTSSSPLLAAVELQITPLARPSPDDGEMSCAALIWPAQAPAIRAVLGELIDIARLVRLQRQVIDGEKVPSF